MKKINVFIGSSIDADKGLTADRDKLASFVNGLNNRYIDRGYFINLYLCENTPAQMSAGGSQKRHDEFIENSADASFFLFFKNAGKYTLGELALAHKTLKEQGRPAVFIFFKTSGKEPENTAEVKNAVDIIANEYAHYYKLYNDIDTVKLEILQYFASRLPAADILARDGKVYLNNEMVEGLELNNIFAYRNSGEYKALSAEIASLQKNIDAAVKTRDYKEIERLCNLKNEKIEDLHGLEKNILEMLKLLQKELGKKEIDKTRVTMLKLLESGDYKGALKLCPLPTVESEAELFFKRKQLADENFMQEAKNRIETAKVCILALKIDGSNPNRFKEIERRYTIACRYAPIACDGAVVYDYVNYLYAQRDYKKAIEIGEKLKSDYECGSLPLGDGYKSALLNLLAVLYIETQRLTEAEVHHKKAIEIRERLTKNNPSAYESALAMSYNNLALLYSKTQRFTDAEELYRKAIEINERLSKENPSAYESDLAASYNNLANLYSKIKRFIEAEGFYRKAIEIKERLSKDNPSAYESDLAASYNNLALLYSKTQRFTEAEEHHKKSIEIKERLVKDNPSAYESDLANSYTNLANLYCNIQRFAEAEELYRKAIEINERLSKGNPSAYEPDLAASYNNLALLYSKTQRFTESEEFYRKAIEIDELLSKDNPNAHEPFLAMCYSNLALLYSKIQRFTEAEELYKKVIEINERLSKDNPSAYEPDLAISYNNLSVLYSKTQRFTEAEEFYSKAIEINKRLAKDNPSAYEPALAMNYDNLANLYCDIHRFAEAEEFHKKAIEIKERLAKDNPSAYESDLAMSYNNLAVLYSKTQEFTDAKEFYSKAIEINKRLAKDNPSAYEPDLANSYFNLALLYHLNQEHTDEATEYFEKVMDIAEKYPHNSRCFRLVEKIASLTD